MHLEVDEEDAVLLHKTLARTLRMVGQVRTSGPGYDGVVRYRRMMEDLRRLLAGERPVGVPVAPALPEKIGGVVERPPPGTVAYEG